MVKGCADIADAGGDDWSKIREKLADIIFERSIMLEFIRIFLQKKIFLSVNNLPEKFVR